MILMKLTLVFGIFPIFDFAIGADVPGRRHDLSRPSHRRPGIPVAGDGAVHVCICARAEPLRHDRV